MHYGNWTEAAKRFYILQKAYPNIPTYLIQYGVAVMKSGDLMKSKEIFIEAKKKFPLNAQLHIRLAENVINQENLEEAEELLHEGRMKFPQTISILLKSAELKIKKEDFKSAQEYTRQAESLWNNLNRNIPLPTEENNNLIKHSKENIKINNKSEKENYFLTKRHLINLIWTKAIFNIKSEAKNNYLGHLWWIIEPILHVSVYYLVFGFLLDRGVENFSAFLLTGLVPWLWFSKSVSFSSQSIVVGKGIMWQTGIPPIFFPSVKILQILLKQIPVFLILIIFLITQGYSPSLNWAALLPIILLQILLIYSVCLSISSLMPFIKDIGYLIPTSISFLFFVSGIFYDYKNIPLEWQNLFLKNPIAYILKSYREILIDEKIPDMLTLTSWIAIGIVFLLLSFKFYNQLRNSIPKATME